MEKDYSARVKQLQNLAMFKHKTEDEIIEWIKVRDARQEEEPPKPMRSRKKPAPTQLDEAVARLGDTEEDAAYERLFNEKLSALQKEYGIDMNSSNDAETLKTFTRAIIQQEVVNRQIIKLQREEELDTRTLKNLGDYQKTLVDTMTNIQEKLGINRRQRKEKQVDSIPQFVDLVRSRSRVVWNRSTTPIMCNACQITLATYWLNFPKLENAVSLELTCWKCGEKVLYNK